MTTQQIYKQFLIDMNKDDTNEGINILPSHFVLMFNTEAVRWLGQKLKDDGDNVQLNGLDELLESDVQLTKVAQSEDSVEFQLPSNYYRHASSFVKADRGECKGHRIFTFEKKPLGFNSVLADGFSGPQFDYEETPFIVTKNKFKVYFDDFQIKSAFVSFYKRPDPIDMAGYEKIDGTISVDQHTNLIDEHVDEVLTRLVARVSGNVKDLERFQIAKERSSSEP